MVAVRAQHEYIMSELANLLEGLSLKDDEASTTSPVVAASPAYVLPSATVPDDFVVVDDLEEALRIAAVLHDEPVITFDCEGVDLGRKGELTVVSISAARDGAMAFVFDIKTIGSGIFASTGKSLKSLLESTVVRKVTFDCRTDSDALKHQFGVVLAGCYDLQTLDQAIKRTRGTYEPSTTRWKAFVIAQKKMAPLYVSPRRLSELTVEAPHKSDMKIWKQRPLTTEQWSYAAFDVLLTYEMYKAMKKVVLSSTMEANVIRASEQYTRKFRDYVHDVNLDFMRHKTFIMTDVDITK